MKKINFKKSFIIGNDREGNLIIIIDHVRKTIDEKFEVDYDRS